jgi:hypothetical protein
LRPNEKEREGERKGKREDRWPQGEKGKGRGESTKQKNRRNGQHRSQEEAEERGEATRRGRRREAFLLLLALTLTRACASPFCHWAAPAVCVCCGCAGERQPVEPNRSAEAERRKNGGGDDGGDRFPAAER